MERAASAAFRPLQQLADAEEREHLETGELLSHTRMLNPAVNNFSKFGGHLAPGSL